MKLSPRYFLLALVCLLVAASGQAQTYSSDPNIADFTNGITSYATFTNYALNQGCTAAPFTPTSAELASTACRVYVGTLAGTGLDPANNWIEATFPEPVSTIVVFPNMDHFGSAYDGYQYQIAGSNDGRSWTLLFNPATVNPCVGTTCISGGNGEPFTLGTFTSTALTIIINNVLSNYPSTGLPSGCAAGVPGAVPIVTPTYNPALCTMGYIATFTFGTAYQYYAFGASSEAITAGNTDQELSAVGTTQQVGQRSASLSVPTSGALLTIIGQLADHTSVNIYRYDSQIHSGVVQVVPVGTDLSNCNSTDAKYPTDAYRLQGSSWTGCDGGDASEITDSNAGGPLPGMVDIMPNNQEGAGFHVETHYCANGSPCVKGTTTNGMGQTCNTNMTVCANPDTGFVSVTNNTGQGFTGTIALSGNQRISMTASPYCPMAPSYPINGAGAVLDSFLAVAQGPTPVTLSMGGDSSACDGFNAPQIALLTNGTPFTYNIGKDLLTFTPLDSCSNNSDPLSNCVTVLHIPLNTPEYLKVLPVPVPAGPLGSNTAPLYGPFQQQQPNPPGGSIQVFGNGQFGIEMPVFPTAPFSAANYPAQACVPIASFSGGIFNFVTNTYTGRDPNSYPIKGATFNPVCPELELDAVNSDGTTPPADAETFVWNATLGFTSDPIVGAGIGGVHALGEHRGFPNPPGTYDGTCPTAGFNIDSIISYTGDPPGIDWPSKTGNSCFVSTYEPGAAITQNNQTASTFLGFYPPLTCPLSSQFPTGPCTQQTVTAGSNLPLTWTSTATDGTAVTNFMLCTDASVPEAPSCPGIAAGTPWVWMGFISLVSCPNGPVTSNFTDDTSGASGLQYVAGQAEGGGLFYPPGTWRFTWKTPKPFKGCVTPVQVFSTGSVIYGVVTVSIQ